MALLVVPLFVAGCAEGPQALPTLDEVFARERWEPGPVEIEGEIHAVSTVNTTKGPMVRLQLADDASEFAHESGIKADCIAVLADPAAAYVVGQAYRTTLHFQEFVFQGVRAVGAPELACFFPDLFQAMADLTDVVAFVHSGALVARGNAPDGWFDFEIATQWGATAPLAKLDLALYEWHGYDEILANSSWTDADQLAAAYGAGYDGPPTLDSPVRWILAGAYHFVALTGTLSSNRDLAWRQDDLDAIASRVDHADNLAEPPSGHHGLRFVDSNGDGLAGSGDVVRVRLDLPAHEWRTYFLQLGCWHGCVAGLALLVVGPDGPVDWENFGQTEWTIHEGQGQAANASTLRIRRNWGAPMPTDNLELLEACGARSGRDETIRMDRGDARLGNVTVAVLDQDGNGLLDDGDGFRVAGWTRGQRCSLEFSDTTKGEIWGLTSWVAGHGVIGGEWPSWSFEPVAGRPAVTASVEWPGWMLDFSESPTATVTSEGETLLQDAVLKNGVVGAWQDGFLEMQDLDGSASLSDGDALEIRGITGRKYTLEVSAHGGAFRETAAIAT